MAREEASLHQGLETVVIERTGRRVRRDIDDRYAGLGWRAGRRSVRRCSSRSKKRRLWRDPWRRGESALQAAAGQACPASLEGEGHEAVHGPRPTPPCRPRSRLQALAGSQAGDMKQFMSPVRLAPRPYRTRLRSNGHKSKSPWGLCETPRGFGGGTRNRTQNHPCNSCRQNRTTSPLLWRKYSTSRSGARSSSLAESIRRVNSLLKIEYESVFLLFRGLSDRVPWR